MPRFGPPRSLYNFDDQRYWVVSSDVEKALRKIGFSTIAACRSGRVETTMRTVVLKVSLTGEKPTIEHSVRLPGAFTPPRDGFWLIFPHGYLRLTTGIVVDYDPSLTPQLLERLMTALKECFKKV